MKGKHIISLMIAATMLAPCGREPGQTFVMAEGTSVSTTVASTAPVEVQIDYEISDPEIKDETDTLKRATFYRDGNPIKAKVMLPEGKGPFKTIIVVGGLYASLGFYSEKAQVFNDNGCAVVEIRPTNNRMPAFYKEPEYLGDFVFEQMLDLFAVMDALKYFPEVDLSNIYLFGHSMGGLATVYAGVLRQNEIKGMILAEPSFQYPERMRFENEQRLPSDFYSFLSGCKVPVVIMKGTGDRPDLNDFPHFYDKANESIPKCELVIIDGADHLMSGEYGKQMAEQAIEVLKAWENKN